MQHGSMDWRRLVLGAALWCVASAAHAVPSFARQTGAECAACHVGAYGPQLTPYGMKFKIGGYTETNGSSGKWRLSAMLIANFTHTSKDAAEADTIEKYSANDNVAAQELSLFVAGRLAPNLGAFIQGTYSGVDRRSALDQFDIRFARELQLGGKAATFGVSLNGNPTLTDPFNTLGQWRFPYTSSDFNAGFGPAPLVEELAGGVAGANAYLFANDHWYGELGLYKALSPSTTDRLHTDNVGKFSGPGTYWRLAWLDDRKRSNWQVGLSGFDAKLQPDREDLSGITDKYRDLGVDASWQFLGDRSRVATVTASYVHEKQTLDYTQGRIDEADSRKGHLDQLRLAGSYTWNQTWGVTAALFDLRGNRDATRFESSLNGKPDTTGLMLQADWTPFGKENSWRAPWANLRIGLQYTLYDKFLGGSSYLDGDGARRKAGDNDTIGLFLWTSL